jgi:aminoglycoside 6'-N-acetyltransferase I
MLSLTMDYKIVNINESERIKEQAKRILLEAFPKAAMWPDINEQKAVDEVNECVCGENICIGLNIDDQLIGWIGLRPMYEKTWELQPIAVKPEYQGKGYGKILLNELEKKAREKGIIGIFAGSDDETNKTSLSEKEITSYNIYEEIKNIKNYKNHPYEFYIKCGYTIVGVIPNANGANKPDIWLWKDIRKSGG